MHLCWMLRSSIAMPVHPALLIVSCTWVTAEVSAALLLLFLLLLLLMLWFIGPAGRQLGTCCWCKPQVVQAPFQGLPTHPQGPGALGVVTCTLTGSGSGCETECPCHPVYMRPCADPAPALGSMC
jgi:hypothetical protein